MYEADEEKSKCEFNSNLKEDNENQRRIFFSYLAKFKNITE